jgi:adenosylhomocysteinase
MMDTAFAVLFEAARNLRETDRKPGLHAVPDRLDRAVAERKLATLDTTIDDHSDSQEAYDRNWRAGF